MTSESGWLNDQGELCLRAARALEELNSVAAGSQKFSMGMGHNGPPKFIMQGPHESRWVMIIPTGSNRLCLAVPSPVPLGVPCNSLLQSALL